MIYVVALVWFAYTLEGVVPQWAWIVALYVAPFAAGFLVGRLWAVALPAIVVLLAVPAGQGSGEIPVFVGMFFVALIALPAIVIGWAARLLTDRFVIR